MLTYFVNGIPSNSWTNSALEHVISNLKTVEYLNTFHLSYNPHAYGMPEL